MEQRRKTRVIVAVALVVIAIGILVYAYGVLQQRNEQAALSQLGTSNQALANISRPVVPMRTSIVGCAKTGSEESTTKGTNSGEKKSQDPTITVTGKTITYSHALSHACCKTVEIKQKSTSSTISITEYWQGDPCKCSCFSTLQATAPLAPSGIYDVNVYERGSSSAQSSGQEEPKLILQKQITVE